MGRGGEGVKEGWRERGRNEYNSLTINWGSVIPYLKRAVTLPRNYQLFLPIQSKINRESKLSLSRLNIKTNLWSGYVG